MDQNHCTLNTKHFKIALKKRIIYPQKSQEYIIDRFDMFWSIPISIPSAAYSRRHLKDDLGPQSNRKSWAHGQVESRLVGATHLRHHILRRHVELYACMHTHIYIYILYIFVYYILAIIIHLDALEAQAWYSNKPCHAPMRCLPVELGGSTLADLNTMLSMGLVT